jgi:hypothetical protein
LYQSESGNTIIILEKNSVPTEGKVALQYALTAAWYRYIFVSGRDGASVGYMLRWIGGAEGRGRGFCGEERKDSG